MQTTFAVLADYVVESREGKLTIAGMFDRIWVETTPVIHPRMFVVARFAGRIVEGTDQQVRIAIVDSDGEEILRPLPLIPVTLSPSGPGRPLVGQIIVQIDGARFPSSGDYEINISDAEGTQLASIALTIARLEIA